MKIDHALCLLVRLYNTSLEEKNDITRDILIKFGALLRCRRPPMQTHVKLCMIDRGQTRG